MVVEVVRGDITTIPVDAVTAAHGRLVGGSGVNGAVHAATGPELLRASSALAPCPPSQAVVTPAFRMTTARWVIHAVGPRYQGAGDAARPASAYTVSLARDDEVGARTMAFPGIFSGVYGCPEEEAAKVSLAALRAAGSTVQRVLLVAFSGRTARLWEQELGRS